MPPPLRLVFLGSDAIALPLLNWLSPSAGSTSSSQAGSSQAGEGRAVAEVVGVFTQPDRPVGRGQKVQPNAIKTWAVARNLPLLQPEKLTADARGQLAAFDADV